MKKIISYILTICMLMTLAPAIPVIAAEDELVDPGYTNGTLLAHYELNDEFISSDIGKIVFKSVMDEETDGYKVISENDGIKIQRTAETGNSTQYNKVGFNLVVPESGDKDDLSATNYMQGLKGVYAVEMTLDLQIIKLGDNTGRTDMYFTASNITDSATKYSIVGNNHIRFFPYYAAYFDATSDRVTYATWTNNKEVTDLKFRTVIDTVNKKSYSYLINPDGSYTYKGELGCSLNSLNSITFAPRGYVAKDSYVKFKDIKIYELDKLMDLNAELAKITADSITGGEIVKSDLTLPLSTDSGCTVAWDSKNDDIISDSGVLNTDKKLYTDTTVTFTVTVSYNGKSASKDIDFVIAKNEEPGGESGGESGGETDGPGYTGGTLLAHYDLNEEFISSDLGKIVFKSVMDEETDGYKVISENDGVKIQRTAETGNSTQYNKVGFNLVVPASGGKDDLSATNYMQGLKGVYAIEMNLDLQIIKLGNNTGRNDMYFTASNISDSSTKYSIAGNNHFRIYPDHLVYHDSEDNDGNIIGWTTGSEVIDLKTRTVIDTVNKKVYNYIINADGSYEFIRELECNLNSLNSITFAPRGYVAKDSYVKFKDIKIYEIDKYIDLNAEIAKITADSITGGEVVKSDLTLPLSTDSGCTVAWDSKNDDIISDSGVLNTDKKLDADTTVTFTVTVSYNGKSASKDIEFVIAKNEEPGGESGGDSGEEPGGESGGDSGEEPGGESGGESGGETDAPDYTGGKLIADYNLNKDFANSTLGQMVIVETFDKAVDGFEATYSDDGITITQTNEGTANTSINKFALNLVTVVDEDKKNNTATYQTGLSGIYALELTMQLDSSSSSKRIDMYFNSKRAVTVGPVTTANNFRIMTNKNAYFQNATDGRNVDKWTEGEDWTLRFVVDTFKHEIYGYNVDKDGNCTYKFTAPYTLNSFGSVTYAPRLYLPQDFFVTFKNMKIYEIKKDTEGMANLFGDTFIASLPETLVPDPENVSESFTMPSTTSTVKSSNENVIGVNGTVINSFEDKYEYIKFTSNVGDVYYDKIYNLLIKAREDISVKNIATYDYSNEEDYDTLKELGDGKITDNGYEIANTSTNSGVVGILKAEYSSDSNTKTYYFDHKGAQDFEINLNPELTTGAGYVEVGNYNEKNGKFVPFGSVKITPNGIEYIDEKEDVVVATEATNGKDYSLKFRTFVNEKKIWLFVNDNKFSETPFSYSNGSPLNAFRIYMEGADTNDTILIKNAELVQQIYGVPAKNCLDAISTVTTNTITNNPMDAYGNINLPVIEGYNVVWSTNNPLADLVNKKIYRSTEEENITIFAHVSKVSDPSVYVIKEFYLKVKAASNEKELLEGALAKITAESLTNQDINSIIADLELPSKTEEGYTITWDSLNDDIISDKGVINKNINISKDTEVVLKATVSSGSVSDSKEIKFTIAKRGKDILVNPSVLVEDVSDVVTYSAEVGTNAGNAYLCDEAGNKIIGFKILDSKLSLEYKNAPVNEFEITDATNIKFVMNSNHSKVSVYADNNLLADYVPYLENATGFNKVTNNGLAINNQNVIFDEYSLINYNVKVYDYFEVISKGYITENVELKKASLGGVKVEWNSSNDTILSVDGSFEAPTMITNFEITATVSVNGGTDAKLVEVIKCVAVPDENSNLFNNAKIASNMTEDVVNDRTKAIDGDLNTYFVATSLKEKSQITIDMGVMKDINSLYFFRDADDENVNSCEIYVSKDGKEWGTPVAVHTFAGIESNQVVFELQNARYIKITNINTNDKTIKLYEVKGYISYSSDDKAHIDIAALEMPEDYILTTEKLVLPTIGSVYGSKLTWTSSDTSIISLDGTVKKPSSKTEVVLTVTAEFDGKKSVKSFIYLVNGKASAGGGASGGGGGGSVNTSGIHTGGAGIAALPTEPTIEQKPSEENLKTEFVDVKVSDWYYTYLIDLKNKGVVSGYDDGSFKPANTVTREEFIKMIISAAGIELSAVNEGFEDVSANDWFAKYVYTAKENGIVNGIDENNFGTGRPVSRQDMSVIICNILNKETMTSDEVFVDDENIASYAKNAVYTMKALEVLNGYEDGTFNPSGNLTRAEAVKVISIVLKLM